MTMKKIKQPVCQKSWLIHTPINFYVVLKKLASIAPVTHSLQPVGNLLATKISSGRREVAGGLQGGRRPVANQLQMVAGTIWSQGGFGCCNWNLSATKSIVEKVFGGPRQVADRSPTGCRLIADQLQRLQTIPTQFLVADWSLTSRRSVADRTPKSCRISAIINKRSRYSRQPVTYRSPIGCQSLRHWSPTDCQLIADGSATTVRLHDSIV